MDKVAAWMHTLGRGMLGRRVARYLMRYAYMMLLLAQGSLGRMGLLGRCMQNSICELVWLGEQI
ncbi:hypothetical protein Dimus_015659, partial [Dionaea muscipula]